MIVCATGFHVTDSYTYVQIKGVGEDLVDRWNRRGRGAPRVTVANLFFLLGPNWAGTQLRGVHDPNRKDPITWPMRSRNAFPDGRATGPTAGTKPVQPGAAAQAGWVGVEQWRLPQLVSRRHGKNTVALVRLHLAILADHPLGQPPPVPVLQDRQRFLSSDRAAVAAAN